MTKANTQIAQPIEITPAAFDGKTVIEIVDNLDSELRSIALDGSTKKGRDECIALSARVRKSKTHIDKVGMEIVRPLKEKAKAVDTQRKYCKDKLDALAKDLRLPATEWEAKEADRLNDHRANIQRMGSLKENVFFKTVAQLGESMLELKALYDREYQEFQEDADNYYKSVEAAIEAGLVEAKKREDQERELERLRKIEADKKAEDDKKAREEHDLKVAEEATKRERERIAKEEAEKQKLADDKRKDRDHATRVHRAIVDGIRDKAEISENWAKVIVAEIAKGKIPCLKIDYTALSQEQS